MFLRGFDKIQKILMPCYVIILCLNVQMLFGMNPSTLASVIEDKKKLEFFWAQENINDDIDYTIKKGVPVSINFSLQKELPRHIIDMCNFVKYLKKNKRFSLQFTTLQELERKENNLSSDIKRILESNSASNISPSARAMRKMTIAKILQHLFITKAVVASSVVYEDIETYSDNPQLDTIKSQKLKQLLSNEQENQKKVNEQYNELSKKCTELQAKIVAMTSLINNRKAKIKKIDEDDLEKSNSPILSDTENNECNFEDASDVSNKEKRDYEEEIKRITAQKESVQEDLNYYKKQLKEKENVLVKQAQELEEAKKKVTYVEQSLDEQNVDLTNTEISLTQASEQIKKNTVTINDQKKQIEELQKTIENLKTEKKSLEQKVAEQIEKLPIKYEQDTQSIEAEKNALQDELSKLNSKEKMSPQEWEVKCKDLVATMAELQFQIEALTTEKGQLIKANAVYKSQVQDLTSLLDRKTEDIETVQTQYQKATTQKAKLEEQIENYERYVAKLEEQIESYERYVAKLNEQSLSKDEVTQNYKPNDIIAQQYTERWSNKTRLCVSAASLLAVIVLMHIAAKYSNSIVSFETLLADNLYKSFDYLYIGALANWDSLQEIIKRK